jgi:hypothetical protein
MLSVIHIGQGGEGGQNQNGNNGRMGILQQQSLPTTPTRGSSKKSAFEQSKVFYY